ncbi:hypothetical protein SASPL_150956 [Salvia splendens]|uniref:DNA-directed DNA polymerase family A palm domain-containing protein n=1 Tax=Salvia splendens TaxID=180675 RepID=A0A8X8Z2Y1_SALSN|nr:hypothetical protein SASPL_150956 [Salvia splendens]
MAHGAPSRLLQRSRDRGKSLQGKYDDKLGTMTKGMLSDEQMLRMCRRFYVALILSKLVQEVPVGEVCEGFLKLLEAWFQALQENAGRFASMVSVFCERLGWHDLESLVSKFQHRVSFGVRAEIVELTAILLLRSRALYRAGYEHPKLLLKLQFMKLSKQFLNLHGVVRAEEARVAAFSAFKSLGLDVGQLSRPLDASRKEPSSSSGRSLQVAMLSFRILRTGLAPDPTIDIGGVKHQLNEHVDHGREQQPENENLCMGSRVNKPEKAKQDDHSMGSKNVLPPNLQVEMAKKRWTRFGAIMGKTDIRKFTWNLKVQIQVLKRPAASVQKFSTPHGGIKSLGLELIDNSYFMFSPIHLRNAIDLSVVAWILSPDEEKSSCPNLEKEAKRRLSSDAAASTNRSGRWKDQTRRAAHNGCCRRVAQTRALSFVLWKLLHSEELIEPLLTMEVRLVNILADMEISGIGVDMEGCLRARHVLGKKLKLLEKEAYRLAGKTFSLLMPADIANILYEHLKLPMPEGYEGKNHHRTDKHCLEMLRLSMRAQKYTLHGHWLQTSTATGRLSIEEPNLQSVEHMVEFEMNEGDGKSCVSHYKINARDFFVPTQDDWVLLTADYCQIELRLMAHFSKDRSLIELLTSPQADVFTMIAAKWSEKHESSVSSQDRERTKRLVYGILYGMGPNTLAEQLDCSPDEATETIQNFKKSFPGVASWLQEAVTACHKKGYVKTLKGRKRFLSNIKFGNSKEKSKAQRQAVNSICQGSAADIIKIAMICLHDVIGEDSEALCPSFIDAEKIQLLKGRCRILLQVHDELVLEADHSVVKEAGLLLQSCMERAMSLLGTVDWGNIALNNDSSLTSLAVPLPVKIKVGKTWGSLEPFDPNC